MLEMANTGEEHGEPGAVGCLNDVTVPDGAAWLDDGGHAGFDGTLDAIGEGEVGI
jgi:hypothetical protein